MLGKPKTEKVKEYLTEHSQSLIDYFNLHDIFEKILEAAKKVGTDFIYRVLVIYYTLKSGVLPSQAVILVTAALGYFLMPLDIIPDFMGAIGFSDDALALSLAMNEIKNHITQETKAQADAKLLSLFPTCKIPSLDDIS